MSSCIMDVSYFKLCRDTSFLHTAQIYNKLEKIHISYNMNYLSVILAITSLQL